MSQDALSLHKELLLRKYEKQTPEELGIDIKKEKMHICSTELIKSLLRQLVCTMLPTSRKIRTFDFRYCNYMFNARRCYVYDEVSKSGTLYERSIRKFFSESVSFFGTLVRFIFSFKKTKRTFQERQEDFTSLAFWEKYLRI